MMRWLAAGISLGLSCLPACSHAHAHAHARVPRDCAPRHMAMVLDDGQGAVSYTHLTLPTKA